MNTWSHVPTELWARALVGPAADFLSRPGKHLRAMLVEAGWRLGGGAGECPEELGRALEVLHAGSLIIDDIEDDATHRRGAPALHRRWGLAVALNTGNWMYFVPQQLITQLGLPPDVELTLHRTINLALLRCHVGQGLDLTARPFELERSELPAVVAATTSLKTGTLTELAISIGAIAAGASPDRVRVLGEFAGGVGVALQMYDDLGSLGGRDPHKRHEDLRLGRATWPWAWLTEVLDDDAFTAAQTRGREAMASLAVRVELAGYLQQQIGDLGRSVARAHLATSVNVLTDAVGTGAAEPITRQLRALEQAYV